MTVQVVYLNTGEHIITDLGRYVDKTDEQNKVYLFRNPLQIELPTTEFLLTETAEVEPTNDVEVRFINWLRFSKNNECLVELQNVVSISEPLDELLELYQEAINSGGHTHERTSLIEE
jgi:hypothetical protein